MQKVKVESMTIGKTEDYILLKPDVEEGFDADAVRGYAFHFANGEACAEAFKMCGVLAKISEDNLNGWEMFAGSVGDSDAIIFGDAFSSECYTFTFYEQDMHTAHQMTKCYLNLVHADENEEEEKIAAENARQDAYDDARHVYEAAIANGCSEQDARAKASRVLDENLIG